LLALGVATAGMGRPPELPAVPPGDALAFRLMRYGSQIGTHAMAFQQLSDGLDVHIAVQVLVKFGPIPFVRYTHNNLESWRGGSLAALAAQTDRNGTELHMRAWRSQPGLEVEGSGAALYVAPSNALPTTYWNPRMLDGPMIGTQDGMLVRPKVSEVGIERIPLANGATIPTRHYTLRGALNLDLFYDLNDVWAGMTFTVADGSRISYERL
jgi:hypothetical protein